MQKKNWELSTGNIFMNLKWCEMKTRLSLSALRYIFFSSEHDN